MFVEFVPSEFELSSPEGKGKLMEREGNDRNS